MDEYSKKLEKKAKISHASKQSKTAYYDPFSDMMDWESGNIDEKRTKRLFQHLVDTGQAFHLQGMYGRAANDMLESGFIHPPHHGGKGQKDYYGNDMEPYYKRFK